MHKGVPNVRIVTRAPWGPAPRWAETHFFTKDASFPRLFAMLPEKGVHREGDKEGGYLVADIG